MYDELFSHPASIERHRVAPHRRSRQDYLEKLRDDGYSTGTLRRIAANQVRLVCLLDLNEHELVRIEQIERVAQQWSRPGMLRFANRGPTPRTREDFVLDAVRWLRFLGKFQEPEKRPRHIYTEEVDEFSEWARNERGYSEASIVSFCEVVNNFLAFLSNNDIALASVTIGDVDRAIMAKAARPKISRISLYTYTRYLRVFFRFAEDRNRCSPGIAAAIMAPRIFSNEKVPARLERKDVLRLLATTEGEQPADKRDRAILLLLAVYGLRSAEVRNLQLDDIDWEKGSLRVRRSKTRRTDEYPLSRNVGEAIIRYTLDVRPSLPDRTLFVTLRAPFQPLTRFALWQMIKNRLSRIGIVDGPRGPHALRHAVAQHLLDQGRSLKVIGDFLGHASTSSTRAYAKVDLRALREVADFPIEELV